MAANGGSDDLFTFWRKINARGEQRFKFGNHPRENVSWYEVMAFCRWLSWRLGGGYELGRVGEWLVRLPTEFEWEKVARGTDGRQYPYGNEFDKTKGNTHETDIGQTSAVGLFPQGASPYGMEELSGNVWEWCLTDYENPALEAAKENIRSAAVRVLRGGAFDVDQNFARAVFRGGAHPDSRHGSSGFRVCGPPFSIATEH